MTSDEAEPEATVGVGPWAGEPPAGDQYDPELLASGDRRNVVDRYRYWRREAIVADLDRRRHDFHVAIENWQHDLNIGTVVRNANAFLAAEVHIVGRRRWNRRGAMVTDRYQHVRHHPTIEEFVAWAARNALALRTTVPMLRSCCQFSTATWKGCRRRSRSATIASCGQPL